jgi:hypothetical protein
MGEDKPFWEVEDEEEEPEDLLEQIRTSFSLIALAALLLAAAGVATVGGLVAAGVGGEPLQRPDGTAFTFQTNTSGDVAELTIRYGGEEVPNPDRLYVVDEDGNRVAWQALGARANSTVIRVSGTHSAVTCLRQGATYRLVFDGRATSGTLAAHEIGTGISAASVTACQDVKSETETPEF